MARSPTSAPRLGAHPRSDIETVMHAVRVVVQSLRVSGRQLQQNLGISSAQLYVLQELEHTPALSINELAERTYTHQSSVSMVVARLVEQHLAIRTASRTDHRSVSIALTASGRKLLRRSPDAAQPKLIKALRKLPHAQLADLATNLKLLCDIIEEQRSAAHHPSP